MLDSLAVSAAEIMLMAMRAAWSPSVLPRETEFYFNEKGREFGHEEMVSILSRAPKPLQCTGVLTDGAIILKCTPVPGGSELERHSASAAMIKRALYDDFFSRWSQLRENPPVLVCAGDECFRTNRFGLERYFEEYEDVGLIRFEGITLPDGGPALRVVLGRSFNARIDLTENPELGG
jgi:hypothetical protein